MCLRGDDRTREVARRKGLWHLAQLRKWTRCRWCMEEVPLAEFSLGRSCGHQYHNVSRDLELTGWGKMIVMVFCFQRCVIELGERRGASQRWTFCIEGCR